MTSKCVAARPGARADVVRDGVGGDVVIPAGEWVFPTLSSAERDPARFPGPDRLDLGRDTSGHVAFGHGVHYCPGAPLARMEAEVALGGLLARSPGLSLAVSPAQLRWPCPSAADENGACRARPA